MAEDRATQSGFAELRGRPAVQAAAVYLGASWAIIEGADIFFPSFGLSLNAIRWLGLVLAIGFVAVVGYVWRRTTLESAETTEAEAGATSPETGAAGQRKRRLAYGATAALLILGGVFWWARPRILGAVSPAAEVIAVMPFHTSGSEVELLGEGMVDLLSPNLDAVGEIRSVDARTVLHRWRQRAIDGSLDLESALQVGRDVEAGSILWGTVASTGPEVRLTADLYTVKGVKLASAQADGPADSVMALVDSLTVSLLRDIWVSREPVPNMRISAVTTGSVDAIRAYLVGEQAYRRSHWDGAIHAFRRAIEADSTFALAQYRLALSYGWTTGFGSSDAVRHGRAALQFAERLPEREKTMVTAHLLFEDGKVAAHDSLSRYVARYPDDAEAWYLLGDVRYHARPVLPFDLEELYAPFQRVLELDPSLGPAFIHPIELAISFRDSAAFVHWLAALENATTAEYAEPYKLAGDIVWGPVEEIPAKIQQLATKPVNLFDELRDSYYRDPDAAWDSALAGYASRIERTAAAGAPIEYILEEQAGVLASLGRYEEARPLFDTLFALDPGGRRLAPLALVLGGLVDSTYAPGPFGILRTPQENPEFEILRTYANMLIFFTQGRESEARGLAEEVLSGDEASQLGPMAGLFRAGIGWADVMAGDTLNGLGQMKDGLEEAGFRSNMLSSGSPLRAKLAITQALHPETRDEGIKRLQYGLSRQDYPYRVLSFFLAGQALEASGDAAGAARAYSLFIHNWENADAELQAQVETARRALERLAGESVGGGIP